MLQINFWKKWKSNLMNHFIVECIKSNKFGTLFNSNSQYLTYLIESDFKDVFLHHFETVLSFKKQNSKYSLYFNS